MLLYGNLIKLYVLSFFMLARVSQAEYSGLDWVVLYVLCTILPSALAEEGCKVTVGKVWEEA